MANLSFNASNHDPIDELGGGITVVPEGWYTVLMEGSEFKPTKNNPNNAYLACCFKILEGEFSGTTVYDNLNIYNDNPTAKALADRTLSAICHAVNVLNIDDTQQLHGIPMKIKVKVRKSTYNGQEKEQNNIVSYKPVDFTPPTEQASTVATASPTPPPAQSWGAQTESDNPTPPTPQPTASAPQPPTDSANNNAQPWQQQAQQPWQQPSEPTSNPQPLPWQKN